MVKYSEFQKSKRSFAMLAVGEVMQNFFAARKMEDHLLLAQLWLHWDMVMGPELAQTAKPLGASQRVLIIGAEDNMLLQDLSFQAEEIKDLANAFMHKNYFLRVKFELLQNRAPLFPPPPFHTPSYKDERPRPENLGSLRGRLDPTLPLASCYEAYIQSFE